jgi:Na+/H+-dicarboxylate symporter
MTALAMETRRTTAWWKELWIQVLIAMAIGVALGILHPDLATKMQPFGDAFIKAIRMLIAPIIFCTVVHGIAHMADMARVGRVALVLGIHRLMSQALTPTNLIGNALATIVVAKWENALDEGRMQRVLNGEAQPRAMV